MKKYEVMTETTIAKTIEIKAANADDAQIAAKQYLETVYEKLPKTTYDYLSDDLRIEIGDAEEIN